MAKKKENINQDPNNKCPICGRFLIYDVGTLLINKHYLNDTAINQIEIVGYCKAIGNIPCYQIKHLGGWNGLYSDDNKISLTTDYALCLNGYEPIESRKVLISLDEYKKLKAEKPDKRDLPCATQGRRTENG